MNSTIKNNINTKGIYFSSIILLIFIIYILSFAINNEIIFPSIITIFSDLISKLFTAKTYLYIGNTLLNLLLSLSLSFIIGTILGILGGLFKYVRLFLKPWMTILRSIPIASSLVIIMIVCGLSITPFVIACITIIPIIYEGFCNGITSIDKDMLDVWKLNSNLNIKVIFKVYIPLILSFIKTSFVLALGLGIKVIIMAEYLSGDKNTLGSALMPASNMLDYASVYSYTIIMILLVLILESLPKIIFKIYNYYKFDAKKKAERD